jgi:hypothetical protein
VLKGAKGKKNIYKLLSKYVSEHADTTDIWNKNNIKLCRPEINEEPGVASRDRGEAYGFEESASNPSDFLTMLCWEEAVRNKSFKLVVSLQCPFNKCQCSLLDHFVIA